MSTVLADPQPTLRTCNTCGDAKPLELYRLNHLGKHRPRCKSCDNAANAANKRAARRLDWKPCPHCGETLPPSAFRPHKHKPGLRSWCRQCEYSAERERRAIRKNVSRIDDAPRFLGPLEPVAVELWRAIRETEDPQPKAARYPKPVDVSILWMGAGIGWQVDVYEPGATSPADAVPVLVRSRRTGLLDRNVGTEHPSFDGFDEALAYTARLWTVGLTVTGPGGVRQLWHLGGSSTASLQGVPEGTEAWDAETSPCRRHDSRN